MFMSPIMSVIMINPFRYGLESSNTQTYNQAIVKRSFNRLKQPPAQPQHFNDHKQYKVTSNINNIQYIINTLFLIDRIDNPCLNRRYNQVLGQQQLTTNENISFPMKLEQLLTTTYYYSLRYTETKNMI